MVEAVDKLLEDTMSEHQPTVQEVATILGDADFPAYQSEAQIAWGDTDDWAISQRATAAMTERDWQVMKERFDNLERRLAAACLAGVQPGSMQADGLAQQHRALLSHYFPVSYGKHALLARGYAAGERLQRTTTRSIPDSPYGSNPSSTRTPCTMASSPTRRSGNDPRVT